MEKTKTLTCKCCGAVSEFPQSKSGNVGSIQRASNFYWLMTIDGGSMWICNETCVPKLIEAYRGMESVLGESTPDVSLYQLSVMVNEQTRKAGSA